MKLQELQEATYSAPQHQPTYYVLDHSFDSEDGVGLVGPFGSKNDAAKYIQYIEHKYGDVVAFTLQTVGSISPRTFERDVADLHNYLTDD
ncbi:MAG: hypothetical protein ACXADH_05710 [Candidatus Kariarchaeaceae archaeon]|jgi:hypothetical protein